MAKPPAKQPGDPRAKATASVWGWTLVILAVCMPLCVILKTAIIPMVLIVSAAAVTFYVWSSGEHDPSENEALRAKIRELEERLANVEVINRFEDRLAEKQMHQQPAASEKARAASPPEATPPPRAMS